MKPAGVEAVIEFLRVNRLTTTYDVTDYGVRLALSPYVDTAPPAPADTVRLWPGDCSHPQWDKFFNDDDGQFYQRCVACRLVIERPLRMPAYMPPEPQTVKGAVA